MKHKVCTSHQISKIVVVHVQYYVGDRYLKAIFVVFVLTLWSCAVMQGTCYIFYKNFNVSRGIVPLALVFRGVRLLHLLLGTLYVSRQSADVHGP